MLIGVDATAFFGVAAGVSRFLREMLIGMMSAAPRDTFTIYSPRPVEIPLAPGGWRARFPREWRVRPPGRWLRDALPLLIAEDRIDVFWGQSTQMPLRLLRPCRRVLTVHDLTALLYPRTMELRNRLYWRLNLRAAVRAADAVVADSRATAGLLSRLLGTPASRVTVIYPGCLRELEPVARLAARREAAARFGLPDEFMLMVGTLEPRKDHATLLEAIKRGGSFPLLVVAGAIGWNSRSILKLVREAEAEGRVRYLGRVSDRELAILYGAAQVMVCPSLYEGFGLPVLEAMVCGCPVVCSWSSSLPEVGGSAARYFRPRDADGLARQLGGVLADERHLAEMRARGLEQAATFSFSRAAEQLLDVLHGAARARQPIR